MAHFSLKEICGTSILSGAISGRRALAQMAERIIEPARPEILFVNFVDVEVATASFLRGSVFDFRDLLRSHQSNFYSVVANANSSVIEELGELAKFKSDAVLTCTIDHTLRPRDFLLIGQLDSKQQLTFALVNQLREADVSEIINAAADDDDIGKTAWNNRLSAVEARGLIMELKRGRSKHYRSICNGVVDGH